MTVQCNHGEKLANMLKKLERSSELNLLLIGVWKMKDVLACCLMISAIVVSMAGCSEKNGGFVALFDGRTLDGWFAQRGDIADWKAEDGILVCMGGG